MEIIELGHKVRDKITGFEGIVIAKCEYINGCIQFEVKPIIWENNKVDQSQWIDIQQLEISCDKIIKITKYKTGGGFRNHP